MRSLRPLVVLATTLVVGFTGVSTAAAGGDQKNKDKDPEIISVSDVYAKDRHPGNVWVEIKYRCDAKNDKGTLEVLLRQRAYDEDGNRTHRQKARYEGEAKADCDGDRHRQVVKLTRDDDRKNAGYAHNGKAHLDVTLTEKGRNGDEVSETFDVDVKGAGHHKNDKDDKKGKKDKKGDRDD